VSLSLRLQLHLAKLKDTKMLLNNRALLLIIAFAACFGAAAIGAAFSPDAWFRGLIKPWFQPPNTWFGPVWTLLYTLMAIAFWRVLISRKPERPRAIGLFLLQLALNAAWSPAFFGAHAIGGALLIMVLLVPSVAATIWLFWRIERVAAWLLVPYLAWLLFALALNAAIWQLNA